MRISVSSPQLLPTTARTTRIVQRNMEYNNNIIIFDTFSRGKKLYTVVALVNICQYYII